MVLFNNIQDLLKEYREHFDLSQESLAERLDVSERTIRRWEADSNSINFENEHTIAYKLHIPFTVIHLLNADLPVFYNIYSRRYSQSYYSRELISKEIQNKTLVNQQIDRIKSIGLEKEINHIIDYDHGIYNTDNPIPKQIISHASKILPELNLYIKDILGYYSGHLVVLPISIEKYEYLKNGLISEGDINTEDLITPSKNTKVALYVSSIYCDCSDTCIVLLKKALNNFTTLIEQKLNLESIISGYVVTQDGNEFAKKFGLKYIFENSEEKTKFKTEIVPTFFELEIKKMKKFDLFQSKNN